MSENERSQGDVSPARKVLEALALAARELTTRFEEAAEQANKVNATLETKVESMLSENSKQADLLVSNQLSGLPAERDKCIAMLYELRREELRTVLSLADEFKDAVAKDCAEILSEFKKEVKTQLKSFHAHLEEKENDINQSATLLQTALKEKAAEQLDAVQTLASEQKRESEHMQGRHLNLLASEGRIAQENVDRHLQTAGDQHKSLAEDCLKELDTILNETLSAQSESFEKRFAEFSSKQEDWGDDVAKHFELGADTPALFADACRKESDIHLKLHENFTGNLLANYRAEVTSITQDTEENMELVEAQLLNSLSEIFGQFNERASELMAKFEKNARVVVLSRGTAPSLPDGMSAGMFLDRIKNELRTAVDDNCSRVQQNIEKNSVDFRSSLAMSGQDANETAEKSFNECNKKIKDFTALYKEDLEELGRKIDALDHLFSVDDGDLPYNQSASGR